MKRFLIFCILVFLLTGCTQDMPVQETVPALTEPTAPGQRLQFTYVIPEEYLSSTTCWVETKYAEILSEDSFRQLVYFGPSEVAILRNGQELPLEEALLNGLTLNQLLYEARLDAENGFCTESRESKNGLSHFLFTYPDYCLWICDDIYETPDGTQWAIEDVQFFAGNGLSQTETTFGGYQDQKTGVLLDQEDWGLSFTLSDITREGATLTIRQSGGQQNSSLLVNSCSIVPVGSTRSIWHDNPSLAIHMDGTTEYKLDFGTLSPEYSPDQEYALRLWIWEDESGEPDTMRRDFTVRQWYTIPIYLNFNY